MEVYSWKIHLFLWAMDSMIFHGYVSHNQRVSYVASALAATGRLRDPCQRHLKAHEAVL
jgi:hypothetical protein